MSTWHISQTPSGVEVKGTHISSSDAACISGISTLKPGSRQAGQRTARELG